MFEFFIYFKIKYFPKNVLKSNEIRPFIRYINDCKNHKRYNRIKILNKNPYISICIPALNMEKYIEQTILSIINQSFQDFEIIIINDNSKDDTEKIILMDPDDLYLNENLFQDLYTLNKGDVKVMFT